MKLLGFWVENSGSFSKRILSSFYLFWIPKLNLFTVLILFSGKTYDLYQVLQKIGKNELTFLPLILLEKLQKWQNQISVKDAKMYHRNYFILLTFRMVYILYINNLRCKLLIDINPLFTLTYFCQYDSYRGGECKLIYYEVETWTSDRP